MKIWSLWKTIAAFVLPLYIIGDNITLFYVEPDGDEPARVRIMGQIDGMDFMDSARAVCERREVQGLFNPSLFCDQSTEEFIVDRSLSLPAFNFPFMTKLVKAIANWNVPDD